jgi:hypothetical protein
MWSLPFPQSAEYSTRHSTIVPFSSGENQLLDTHVNGPDKAGRRQAYAKVQQATIGQVLESYDGDLDAIQKQIAAGADPRLLPTWKAPIDLKIPQPSRAEVILIGRAVRAKLFGTIKGQRIIANGYYDNGLMPRGGVHCDGAEYLLYSARLKRSAQKRKDAASRKAQRAAAKIQKEKEEVLEFDYAMANCGIWVGDEHACDPDEVAETNLDGYC